MRGEVVTVHQTLHGYVDGHRLIKASTSLPQEAKRVMLTLSDLSGPSSVRGFERYLTGYALPGVGFYAFACTWDAPEMQRPGCVWTHTLLVRLTDLAGLADLARLRDLFSRPGGDGSLEAYGKPVVLQEWLSVPSPPERRGTPQVAGMCFLFKLYGTEDCPPVVMSAEGAQEYEDLVLEVWSQQWPCLRNTFAFCTGSLSSRTLKGQHFDLQVVPNQHSRRYTNGVADFAVAWPQRSGVSGGYPKWVDTAWDDLVTRGGGGLRAYLWDLGESLGEGRSAYRTLVELYGHVRAVARHSGDVTHLIEAVAERYPQPSEGRYLKRRFFGPLKPNEEPLLRGVNEKELLRELAVATCHAAFSQDCLKVQCRAGKLWSTVPDEARELVLELTRSDLSPLGEAFLQGVTEALEPGDVWMLSKDRPGLLYVFTRRRPSLAASKLAWQVPESVRNELLDHLGDELEDLPKETQRAIVTAMLEAGADDIAERAYQRFGQDVAYAILEWCNSLPEHARGLPQRWASLLEREPEVCVTWLSTGQSASRDVVVLLASTLDPCSASARKLGTRVWSRAMEGHDVGDASGIRLTLARFLLPLGLWVLDRTASRLVGYSFEPVHEALAMGKLEYRYWKKLDGLLPSLPWYRSWDKCERLRRGLVATFVGQGWPAEDFMKCTSNEGLFSQIVNLAWSTQRGTSFLRKVAHAVRAGEVPATGGQEAILRRYA